MACEEFEGDLYKLIRRMDPFVNADLSSTQTLKELSLQATQGLAFVHGEIDGRNISYVHKDIKPSNFVVRRGSGLKEQSVWICKLTDFGNAKETIQGGSQCQSTTRFGTRDWMAPEVVTQNEDESHRFTKKSDVWSMGCVIHFIFNRGQHPYGDLTRRTENIRLGQPTQQGQMALVKESKSGFKVDDLVSINQFNPNDRPSMQQAVETIKRWALIK